METYLASWVINRIIENPIRQYKSGRKCYLCGKVLSIYNPDHHCFACNLEHEEIMLKNQQGGAQRNHYWRKVGAGR